MKNIKKFLLCLIILCAVLMTGCGKEKEKVSLDLKDLSEKIDSLETDEFARIDASEILNEKIEGLKEVYDTSFKSKFKITSSNIEEYNVATNSKNTDMYFIVKPVEGKEDAVKGEIDKYINGLKKTTKEKLSYEEYKGYLIYIVNENSAELLEEIKGCKTKVFSNLTEIDDESLEQQFGIDKDMVDEYLIKVPALVVNSNSYMILKPAKDKKDAVKEKMNEYMDSLEKQWETYLPDQYDLVKNRTEEEYGDYLIYIISQDNETVLNTIKDSNK